MGEPSSTASRFRRVAYGTVFAIGVPVLGVLWARATEDVVTLPAVRSVPLGGALLAIGLVAMGAAIRALWVRGGGLPMNAFPPPRLVSDGIYRLARHPIYLGFTSCCLGVSMLSGSASGLWLVTPTLTLGWLAIVWGYENRDVARRFGPRPRTVLELPPDEPRRATWPERLGYLVVAIGSWCVLYEAVTVLGVPPDAFSLGLPFERSWPVWQASEAIYITPYPVVLASALFLRDARTLRRLGTHALLACAIAFPLFLLVPIVAPPRPFVASSLFGELLAFERSIDTPGAAFPSFHVAWTWLVARALGDERRSLRIPALGWSVAVAVACVTTGMHTLADIVGGFALALGVPYLPRVWELLRSGTEQLANGLRTWTFGPIRVLSYAMFGFLSTFVGMTIASALAGPSATGAIVLSVALAIVGAGAWAQVLERGANFSRPYGFYGGAIGFVVGGICAPLVGGDAWVTLAAFATGGTVLQGIGRLRCLQQGCCHGEPTSATVGIRYRHPLSRVVKMTAWRDVPLHPTPLYSLLWNLVSFAVLLRLWTLGAALGLIGGLYLVLNGLGRFVEESLRGEPQTKIVYGLRVYQYFAAAFVVAGAIGIALGSRAPAPRPEWSATGFAVAVALAVAVAFVSGVDFPRSEKKFSRLA